jgi:hypothetical protein
VVEVIDAYRSTANGYLPRLPAPGQKAPAPTIGWGLAYDMHEEHQESEHTTFTSQGTVTAADGSTVNPAASLEVVHVQVETREVHIGPGEAPPMEPLVSNPAGGPASIDGRQTFDLDADGRKKNLELAQHDGEGTIQHLDIVV